MIDTNKRGKKPMKNDLTKVKHNKVEALYQRIINQNKKNIKNKKPKTYLLSGLLLSANRMLASSAKENAKRTQ